jgi:hypothetical protein
MPPLTGDFRRVQRRAKSSTPPATSGVKTSGVRRGPKADIPPRVLDTELASTGDFARTRQLQTWGAFGILAGVGGIGIGISIVATSPFVASAAASLILISGVVAVAFAAHSLGVVADSISLLRAVLPQRNGKPPAHENTVGATQGHEQAPPAVDAPIRGGVPEVNEPN